MLSPERLTVKAAEAIQLAAQEARKAEHPQIEGVHLLQALLDQEDGIVAPILNKLGVTVSLIRERTRESLGSRARVSGGSDPGLSRDLTRAMDVAEEEARSLGDEYVSTEHLLLALAVEAARAGDAEAVAAAISAGAADALAAALGLTDPAGFGPVWGADAVKVVTFVPADAADEVADAMAAAGAPEGTIIVADQQTRGRGRFGRTWYSPPGLGKPDSPRSQTILDSPSLGPSLEDRLRSSNKTSGPGSYWKRASWVLGVSPSSPNRNRPPRLITRFGNVLWPRRRRSASSG